MYLVMTELTTRPKTFYIPLTQKVRRNTKSLFLVGIERISNKLNKILNKL